ncbi:MAG: helix-turn-helix domain-containing protein [Candidatus Delongbacteria bacterium]|nr:helix-turn-helix domain-containing protein [Candidatus Delongbacteria bacterium]
MKNRIKTHTHQNDGINKNLKEENQMKNEKRWYTLDEAAEYLSLSKSTLYKKTGSKRMIKYYKPNGSKIYFEINDLDEFVEKGVCITQDEIEMEAEKCLIKWS